MNRLPIRLKTLHTPCWEKLPVSMRTANRMIDHGIVRQRKQDQTFSPSGSHFVKKWNKIMLFINNQWIVTDEKASFMVSFVSFFILRNDTSNTLKRETNRPKTCNAGLIARKPG